MDLTAIRSRVRKLSGVLMVELLSATDLDLIINEAYLHICSLADWSFLYADGSITTTAGTATYPHPSPVSTPQAVAISSPASARALLRQRVIEDFDRYPESEAQATGGYPWAWAVRDHDSITVYPTPSVACTLLVRGWKAVEPLTTVTQQPVFEAEFHPVVTLDAAARVLNEEGDDSGRSEQYREEAVAFLRRMGQRYSLPDPDAAARIYAAVIPEPEKTETR